MRCTICRSRWRWSARTASSPTAKCSIDEGAGGYHLAYALDDGAMRGSWRFRIYADTAAPPITYVSFLVEDFEPERLAFEINASVKQIVPGEVTPIDVTARLSLRRHRAGPRHRGGHRSSVR